MTDTTMQPEYTLITTLPAERSDQALLIYAAPDGFAWAESGQSPDRLAHGDRDDLGAAMCTFVRHDHGRGDD